MYYVKYYAVHIYIEARKIAMSPVEIPKPQKFSEKESTESHKAQFPAANLIIDSRLSYNTELVVCSLL
jgi:hypothetical protein